MYTQKTMILPASTAPLARALATALAGEAAAGMWTVGLAASGNEVGVDYAQWQALDPLAREQRLQGARQRLYQAGAHYVLDSLAELPALLGEIDARLARGERP